MTEADIEIIEKVLIPQGVDYDKPYISPHNLDTVLRYVLDNQNKLRATKPRIPEVAKEPEPEPRVITYSSTSSKRRDISTIIDSMLEDLSRRPKSRFRKFCDES